MPSTPSWRVTSAALLTPAYALAAMIALLVTAELVVRLPPVRATLLAPSVGSPSRRFEMQLDGLRRYAASRTGIDCLILGNSTALTGIDPQALEHAIRQRGVAPPRCYNFGVAGMTASAAGAVAALLVAEYHPSLLLYVVSARDVGSSVDGPLLASVPWVRYRLGEFSLAGWLADHSAAYRYYLLYRQWLDPSRWPAAQSASGSTAAGFFPLAARLPLSPALWEHTERAYRDILAQPLSTAELAGFRQVLQLSADTRLVLIEAPAHPRLRRWADGTEFYRAAASALRDAATQRGVPLWKVGPSVVGDDGWSDFVHVNARGAAQVSDWLGTRLADLLRHDDVAHEAE